VVAQGYDVGASRDELVVDGLGDAEAIGGVFAVDDGDIDFPVVNHLGQQL